MSTDRDPGSIRLPDDVAQRLLARATELDERSGRTSIDQLRRAAAEAGISQSAFDSALAELARGELGRPATAAAGIDTRGSWVTSAFRRRLLVAGTAIAVLLLGLGIITRHAREPRVVRDAPVGYDYAAPTPPPADVAAPTAVDLDVAPAPRTP